MSYNGSGTFQINTSGQPVVTGTVISSSAFNALTADLATGLSTAITKDGQTATTVRIPFAQGINSSLATDTTSGSTGSIFTAGGVGITKSLFVGGTATFSATPIFSALTASSAVATDASKALVSVANTGTGSNVLAVSPTLTGTAGFANITASGTLGVTGVTTVQAGTAALPAITTTGDTNTGIFFPAADTIAFSEGGVECARFNSSGNLQIIATIGVGNATPSTSGSGITFPATQSASTDANTLDDYEEGSWTPIFSGYTGTYSNQNGKYVKIGQLVYIECLLQPGSVTFTTPGNVAAVTGLPFAAISFGYIGSGPGSLCSQGVSFNLTGNDQNATGTPNCIATSSSTIQFAVTGSSGGARGNVLNSAFASNSISEFSCNYRTT